MDTLQLNGNHVKSYNISRREYFRDCAKIIDREFNHKESALEKKILKELTSNCIPSYLNNHERSCEQSRNLVNKLINNINNLKEDDAILDDATCLTNDAIIGLDLLNEESDTLLMPSLVLPMDSQQALHFPRKKIPPDNSESVFPLLTHEHIESTQSPNRDFLYTSMPTLTGIAVTGSITTCTQTESSPVKTKDAEELYYKSMPNLGTQNIIHQLHTYYPLGRGSSDGFIVPLSKDGTPSDEKSGHLVTSL
ncbi:hypothetical protein GDO81_001065 [Engystomops pustulosus]|uniref:GPCR family 2 latrophilin C-terminal domain-containing protein n=1 Tax=Engystomops pustulosus TaxID=76066 RepID=A0AAV7D9K6_ENGPU|nr:hypothetical protein GDO81_001065 [Engystomops pustulosus]